MDELIEALWDGVELLFFGFTPDIGLPALSSTQIFWTMAILLVIAAIVYFVLVSFTFVPENFLFAYEGEDGEPIVLSGSRLHWTYGLKPYKLQWTNPFTEELFEFNQLCTYQRFMHKFEIVNSDNKSYLIRVGVYFVVNAEIFQAEEPLVALHDIVTSTAERFFKDWRTDVDLTYQMNCHKTPYGRKLKKAMNRKGIHFAKLDLLQINTKKQKFGTVIE